MSDQTTSGLMDQIHQLKQQLTAARAARDAVARDYLAAARGEEVARQQLADAEKRGAAKELSLVVALIHRDLKAMSNSAATEPARNALADVARGIVQRITRIESGEETNTDLLVARKLDERADRIERGEQP